MTTDCPTCGHPAIATSGFMHPTYEPVGCTDTADMRERLTKAAAGLHSLMLKAGNPNEQRRLKAKGEGVRLALSYLEDLARG